MVQFEGGAMGKELTVKGRATRDRIVEGTALVLRERGIDQTTLDEVMARTHTSKSQLFHYFRGGKEDLLLAVARFEAEQVLEDQQPYLGCLDSWEAWQQWREVVIKRYEEQGDRCPLASLSQHLGRSTPGARAIVVELMRRWQEHLAVGIRALQEAGHLPREVDVDERAAALLVAIQGGVGILQVTGQSYHLQVALDHAIGDLHRLADQRPAAVAGR
jgi:AcrR family transcriptional regulator